MIKFLKTHGTTFTIGLFLVSAISGVFLFFHLWSSAFHGMHEWLSMLLLVPVVLHIWKNFPSLKGYFKRKTIAIPLALSLIGAVIFAYPALTSSGSGGGNPMRAAIGAIQNGSIEQVAPLYNISASDLQKRLEARGYKVESLNAPLSEIAKTSGKPLGPSLIRDVSFGR